MRMSGFQGKKLGVIIVLVLGIVSCAGTQALARISPADAKALLEGRDPVVLIDVRTLDEYNSGYIAGARHLPHDQINADTIKAIAPDKTVSVIVYCRSGNRSGIAARTLVELGYSKVWDLGPVSAWTWGLIRP